jgi:hypothetical protein
MMINHQYLSKLPNSIPDKLTCFDKGFLAAKMGVSTTEKYLTQVS